jgi:hypothetical protein
MLPGSIHPEGQPVEWLMAPEGSPIAEIDPWVLKSLVEAIAGASLLVRIWPDQEGTGTSLPLRWPVRCTTQGGRRSVSGNC